MENSHGTTAVSRRLSHSLLGLVSVTLIAGTLAAHPAVADEWGRWRGDDWRRQEWREQAWRAERAREWQAIREERLREWRWAQWRARQAYGTAYPYSYPQGYYSYAPTQGDW